MSDKTELKPCPFCGGEVEMHPNDIAGCGRNMGSPGVSWFYAHCDGCGAEGPPENFENEAVEAWNRRATIQPTAREPLGPMTIGILVGAHFLSGVPKLADADRWIAFVRAIESKLEVVAPADAPLTDAQITAGAAILCDCPKPKRIGRNAAIDVAHAMGVVAPADDVRDARDLALEEAALTCAELISGCNEEGASACVKAIRALKSNGAKA